MAAIFGDPPPHRKGARPHRSGPVHSAPAYCEVVAELIAVLMMSKKA